MRAILVLTGLLILSFNVFAQADFRALDLRTYDFYMKNDYRNLRKTADTMLLAGMDYYYLRLRLGIAAYNNKLYSSAYKNLDKALGFNSLDTISREYIYYSFILSGRYTDASLYLKSITPDKKNNVLRSEIKPGTLSVFAGSSLLGNDVFLPESKPVSYEFESINTSLSINAGVEAYFLSRLKATLVYTNLRKNGIVYPANDVTGKDFNFIQNQIYARLGGYFLPGWEVSVFTHLAFFTVNNSQARRAPGVTTSTTKTEYVSGIGLSKNGWKIRTGANISFSNLSNSKQIRCEGNITFLPYGNLNFYLTSGAMLQADNNWGNTYQVNGEAGLNIWKFLWLESGIIIGNSFLYSRNQGYLLNNSFMIPGKTVYCNFILPTKKISVDVTPFYSQNQNYSWNLTDFTRTGRLDPNSFGVSVKLTYNIR
jgi:hypothetical protein